VDEIGEVKQSQREMRDEIKPLKGKRDRDCRKALKKRLGYNKTYLSKAWRRASLLMAQLSYVVISFPLRQMRDNYHLKNGTIPLKPGPYLEEVLIQLENMKVVN
jgi:hypothetical protein